MTVVHQAQPASAAPKPLAGARPSWLESKAVFRYGFTLLILIVWQIAGPFIDPIFFSYPSKIAIAFYDLTVSGDLPYYLSQSLEVMVLGLGCAVVVGIPLGVAMARIRRLDWALDLPINALYSTPTVALVPILVLWFGIYLKAKVIVVLPLLSNVRWSSVESKVVVFGSRPTKACSWLVAAGSVQAICVVGPDVKVRSGLASS